MLSLIALKLAQVKKTIPAEEIEFILDELYRLPEHMQAFLDGNHPIEEIAQRYYDKPFFLYLGRHIGLPVALEGALKLKEISYIPTEAYSAGEMKHGPIALLDEDTPVVCVATDSHVYDKVVSNIQETRARGAHVIAIATDGNEDIQHHADDVIFVPKTPAFLQAVLAILPAPAARVPDRAAARNERRPAAEPGEDRHGRVARITRTRDDADGLPRQGQNDACGTHSTASGRLRCAVRGAHLRGLSPLGAAWARDRPFLLPLDRAGGAGRWRGDRRVSRLRGDRTLRRWGSDQRPRSFA